MPATKMIPASVIVEQLAGRAEELCRHLLPNGHKKDREWLCGSVQGEAGKSLGVHLDGDKAGCWHDFTTGEGGDLIGLVKVVNGLDARDAILWAKDWLGIDDSDGDSHGDGDGQTTKLSPAPRSEKPDLDAVKRTEAALAIWRASRPAGGTAVQAYLSSRAIMGPPPPSLRYHPNLRHGPTGLYFETMVAGVQGAGGRITAVHRTFLLPGGRGKAPVSPEKMALGPIGAGAVRLAAAKPALGISEGIETGLSIMQLFEIPVWAGVGSRLDGMALPDSVIELQIFADNDEAGRDATKRAADVFTKQGRRVAVRFPPEQFNDWNDALVALHREQQA